MKTTKKILMEIVATGEEEQIEKDITKWAAIESGQTNKINSTSIVGISIVEKEK